MKYQNQFPRFSSLLNIALLAGACGFLPAIVPLNMRGQDLKAAPAQPQVDQRTFTSPEEAVKALQTATQTKDTLVLQEIFGPEFQELPTGPPLKRRKQGPAFRRRHVTKLHSSQRGRRQNYSGSGHKQLAVSDSAGESGGAMASRA